MFPSSNKSYIEANTQKDEETCIFTTGRSHMRPGTQNGVPGAHEFALGRLSHESRRLTPEPSLTCA